MADEAHSPHEEVEKREKQQQGHTSPRGPHFLKDPAPPNSATLKTKPLTLSLHYR